MNLTDFFKQKGIHFFVALIFLAIAFIYAFPVLKGKNLAQHDMIQATGAATEVTNYKEKTGEFSWWTNSMFSGMPTYTIKGDYPYSLTGKIGAFISYQVLPSTVNLIFWLLLGLYIMLVLIGFSPWVSVIGSIAFAFSSYNIIIIEAGHVSKVIALAYAPILIAGIVLLYRKKYFAGAIATAIGASLELYANHIQITYYCGIAIVFYVIYKLVEAIRNKDLMGFAIPSAIALVIGGLALGSMASRFWTTYEYTAETIRGPAVLKSEKSDGGLDKDYAYSWSYGVSETFTFLVPDYYGGGSTTPLGENSNTFETLMKYNLPRNTAKDFVENIYGYGGQMYWGDQPSTSGPAYFGAVVIFLFLLSFFLVKNKVKWLLLGIVVLFTMLSWGKNFMPLTDFFFSNVPLYNKFRAVTMIHSVVAIFVIIMACWSLKTLLKGDLKKEEIIKSVKLSGGILGALLLLFIVFSGARDYIKEPQVAQGQTIQTSDDRFQSILEQVMGNKNMASDVFQAFISDRESAFRKDSIRSLIFILLAAGLVWMLANKKIQPNYFIVGILLLVLVDMVMVSKRYLNKDDFIKSFEKPVNPSQADLEIMKDKDPHFRVMNTTVSPFNDATTSFFHKSVGGYSGAKLRRYQDLIEFHLGRGSMNVFNMLNTKYFIVKGDRGPAAQRNPEAYGNAWFVDRIKWVESPDSAIASLDKTDLKNVAVIEPDQKSKLGSFEPGSGSGEISLVSYKPDELVYKTKSSVKNLAVFSEVYYNDDKGWEAYIDGNSVPHFRVDYILRALIVPSGEHEVKFVFRPKAFYTGEKIALVCSILLFGIILGAAFFIVKKGKD